MEQTIYTLNGEPFFEELESHLETTIPLTIKKLLLLCDYDSIAVLKDFNENCITEIRDYLRNILEETMLNENEKMEEFLGRFVQCKQKFEFTGGQRQWLHLIVEKCKNLNTKRPIQTNHIGDSSSVITTDDLKSLRTLLRNWTLKQEKLPVV